MSMDFSNAQDRGQSFDLIPHGTMVWGILTVRGIKRSQNLNKDGKNGSYLDTEIVVAEGEFARRKFWSIIVDPTDMANTEAGRQMGETAIKRILESRGQGMSVEHLQELSGARVGVHVGIEKGTGGYPDKNKVVEFLTPNPASTGNKNWLVLTGGDSSGQATAPATESKSTTPGFLHNTAQNSALDLDDEIPF